MKFEIGTILSITHGRMLAEIGNVYKILNYLLDDDLFTHQLPRAVDFAKKFILAQHPQLEEWDNLNDQVTPENRKDYIEKAKTLFGNELGIEPIPGGVWTYKDPVEELEEMVPNDKIVAVNL